MKTLKQLGVDKHKTGNYANYLSGESCLLCCGWMDIHHDKNSLGTTGPIFKVVPEYWYSNAIFVLKVDHKWYELTRAGFISGTGVPDKIIVQNGTFEFDARLLHGLVPKHICKLLHTHPDTYESQHEYTKFLKQCDIANSPKLVWKFKNV